MAISFATSSALLILDPFINIGLRLGKSHKFVTFGKSILTAFCLNVYNVKVTIHEIISIIKLFTFFSEGI